MPTDLTHDELQKLKANVEGSIEEYSQKLYPLEHRNHLGISEIGEPCSRKTFYKFRWFDIEYFDGRMRRLFARGHREEERYISYLENTGWKVYRFENPILNYHPESGSYFYSSTFDPGDGLVEDVTGIKVHELEAERQGIKPKQFRVSGVLGHYGGSCDGVGISPWYPDLPFILEFKTHNEKSFDKYLKDGLVKSKSKHYDQMAGYGYKMNIQYGLYFPENKNTDEIKVTPIKLDLNRGMQLEIKAEEIILAKQLPARISDNPAYFECKFCSFKENCHNNKPPLKNCRSCKLSKPVENGEWFCSQFDSIIPKEFIKEGCQNHAPI